MSVVVLGSGPAGLMAAHAVKYVHAEDPVIITNRVKSKIGGAQFIHEPIPDINSLVPDGVVRMYHHGKPEVYARKVYGDPNAPTSWGNYMDGVHEIWNMQETYELLMHRYERFIEVGTVDAGTVAGLVASGHTVISSIPLPALLPDGPDPADIFTKQDVWIIYGNDVNHDSPDGDYIVYDGHETCPEYRISRIFGTGSVEFGSPPPEGYHTREPIKVTKPLASTWSGPEGVILVGRYGKWRKRELAHQAFYDIASRKEL